VTREVSIEGPVLLLMGPIGSFFSRLANHLERRGVPVWKVSFPLHEYGFPAHQRVPYAGELADFENYLRRIFHEKGIRHLFMYGDFIDPHRIAIGLTQELNSQANRPYKIEPWVFELGYIRPNYVSLELERVNARSSLNRPPGHYRALPPADVIPQARRETGIRWRKWWKAPTFIQHSFTPYPIISGPHKLQPKPSYLLAQLAGFARKHLYRISEHSIRDQLMDGTPFILVPLQVASDSQVNLSSQYSGMEPFITELIASFAASGRSQDRLVFKHHPRDRGYNHYGRFIHDLAMKYGIAERVLYFHDGALGPILKRARAVITINSTVGLQALYHATPTKVMGQTFYNLEGITDQQSLADFWLKPQASDRELFRKFYLHLIETTQINGNFDGDFPFDGTFRISPELAIHAVGAYPHPAQVLVRLLTLLIGYGTYGLQLLALAIGARQTACRLLEQASRQGLAALGVRVLIDRRMDPISRAQIHIANHGHPLDVLLVQGHFRECSITTAALHLRWLLPFFKASARNYGHISLDHRCPHSRLDGLRQLLRLMQRRGRLFLFPSGSLVTPITERVSGSLYVLSRRSDALIVPWFTTYRGFARQEEGSRYRPFRLLVQRLLGPQATILCREGAPIDPRHFAGSEALSMHIRQLYGQAQARLERAS
jgi:capsular polysaccharide export protein